MTPFIISRLKFTRAAFLGLVVGSVLLPIFGIRTASAAAAAPARNYRLSRIHSAERLPDNATEDAIASCEVFSEPLAPNGKGTSTSLENSALAGALKTYAARKEPDDFKSLQSFLAAHPQSTWRVSMLENLAVEEYHTGYFDKALANWESVWAEGKSSKYPPLVAVVNRGVANLSRMNARLGRVERLKTLFPELKGRQITGPAGAVIVDSMEAYQLMLKHPGESFRCGPLAIESILKYTKLTPAKMATLVGCKSTFKGVSLATLKALSDQLGMNYQLAQRSPGAVVILPAVVHWRVGHYAALTRDFGNRILGEDPTFIVAISITRKALDEETDGYFLVPAGDLPSGWRSVGAQEASGVWGRGLTTAHDPTCTKCNDQNSGGNSNGCCGMPTYQMTTMLVSLKVHDTPISVPQTVGGPLQLTLTYNQRDESPGGQNNLDASGEWTDNWNSYIVDNPTEPGNAVGIYLQNGGSETYSPATTGSFAGYPYVYAPQFYDGSTLTLTSSNSYELDYADGSKEIFNVPTATAGSGRLVFLGEVIDSSSNVTTISYNTSTYTLKSVTGPTGSGINFHFVGYSLLSATGYGIATSGSTLVTSFGYSASGDLQSITDSVGMSSTFSYIGSFINTMTTPYGTTAFSYGDVSIDPNLPLFSRWLQATDPAGGTERLEYNETQCPNDVNPSTDEPISYNTVPNYVPSGYIGFDAHYFNDRNSYYWSKRAYMAAPGNYAMAKVYHWCHLGDTLTTSGVLESVKSPLENRIYYQYPGQGDTIYTGTSAIASLQARVLNTNNPSQSTQYDQYQYNNQGNLILKIDPLNRVTSYNYASNGVDLLSVYQGEVGGGSPGEVLSHTYNAGWPHLPQTTTDAAGQTATYSYDSLGQIQTRAVIQSGTTETTTWGYDGTGHLMNIVGPISSASNSFTYDSLNHIQSMTDSDGRTKTYTYDGLNRLLTVSYQDGTSDQIIYNRLDVEWQKDRVNRWTHTLHDQLRRLTEVIDPVGNTTQYQYCACGALTGIVDPKGNTTGFTLDVESRPTNKTFADGSSITYNYEPYTSRLQSMTDSKQQTTSYTYNLDDTLGSVSYTGSNATPSVSYAYDPVFLRMTSMSDAVTGTTSFNYNPITGSPALGANMLGSVVNTGSAAYHISYGYDELNRVVSRVVDGGTTSTVYDALGRVTQVTNPLGIFSYTPYGGTNMVDHINYPNGLLIQYSYYPASADGRLETIANEATTSGTSIISEFGYGYSSAGDITSWSQQTGANAPVNYQYGYDGADELLQATASVSGSQSPIDAYAYLYDSAGNRTTEQINNSLTSSSYNDLNQLTSRTGGGLLTISGSLSQPATMTVGGGTPFITGSLGNPFSAQVAVVTGSNNIQMSATNVNGYGVTHTLGVNVTSGTPIPSLTFDLNGNLTNDGTQTYKWDSANRLIEVDEASGSISRFAYDGLGRRAQITETATNATVTTKNLVWDAMSICEEKNASDSVTKAYFDQGVQLSGSNYYYTRDQLGSIREVTDVNANVQAEYAYDPYGRQTQTTGTMAFDFGFTGQYYHQPSGLMLAPYREYSASLGRWISRDPSGERGGINLYGYVGNSPLDRTDPLGLIVGVDDAIELDITISSAIGTAIGEAIVNTAIGAEAINAIANVVAKEEQDDDEPAAPPETKCTDHEDDTQTVEDLNDKETSIKRDYPDQAARRTRQRLSNLLRDIANDPSILDDDNDD